jgi:hypothetical protein
MQGTLGVMFSIDSRGLPYSGRDLALLQRSPTAHLHKICSLLCSNGDRYELFTVGIAPSVTILLQRQQRGQAIGR